MAPFFRVSRLTKWHSDCLMASPKITHGMRHVNLVAAIP
jgi:hypothetical protein